MHSRQNNERRTDTDADLVARARQGDAGAFSQLVRRHHASMHRTARAVLGSSTDAEDVTQDAWLHAYVHLAQFQETASFKTWVHVIARNRAIDHYRMARHRRRHGGAPDRALATEVCSARTPEQLLLDTERAHRLAAAIASLPERLRTTLELWHTGEYSYQEIARMAGVRTNTIKSRVWEARRQVTREMTTRARGAVIKRQAPVRGLPAVDRRGAA
jgi:RNA polymerase sigma-70 factor (ECF subfamily)